MTATLQGAPEQEFARPDGVVRLDYCISSGDRATSACPKTASGWFLAAPELPSCTVHKQSLASVPDLSGMSRSQAERALANAGLTGHFATRDPGAAGEPGTVLSQDPSPGTRVAKGTAVTVTLASASRPPTPPKPSFTFSPSAPGAGRDVAFSARGADGSRFTWDFGDGTSGEGRTAEHAYSDPGDYSVMLTAIAPDGTRTQVERPLVVR
jgi:hypothetical protein